MAEESAAQPPSAPLDVYTAILAITEQMSAISWQKLGLQPDIMTGTLHEDLVQARVAIDLTAHLAGLVEGQLDEADRRQLQGMVRDLRVNWLERNKEVDR